MKYKLPIVIVLLAAGGWLWRGKSDWPLKVGSALLGTSRVSQTYWNEEPGEGVRSGAFSSLPTVIQQANFFQSIPPDSQATPHAVVPSMQSDSSASSPAANPQTPQFLQTLGAGLRESLPFKTDLLVDFQWAGQHFPITGTYIQAGQGTGQSKMELKLGPGQDSAPLASISNICDGRFLYTHLKDGSHPRLEFVDLRRVQETRLSTGMAQPNNPTSWIATGGLASLFDNIAAAFRFGPTTVTDIKGVSVWTTEGEWKPGSLAELLHGTVDSHLLSPEIQWDKLPPHIPHRIKIAWVEVSGFGWMPRQMTFSRMAQSGDSTTRQTLVRVQFSTPQSVVVNPQDFLNLQTDEVESIDATDSYVDQVQSFGAARQARLGSGTLIR